MGVEALARLGVLVVGDIGSGLLRPSPVLPREPDADSWLRAGAGLVTASADKLLGGPQAGLMLGAPEIVTCLTRHPLARALRVDKLTLAALEASVTGPPAPVTHAMTATLPSVRKRAEAQARRLALAGVDCQVVPTAAAIGGGGGPGVTLPSAALSLPGRLAPELRSGSAVRRGDSRPRWLTPSGPSSTTWRTPCSAHLTLNGYVSWGLTHGPPRRQSALDCFAACRETCSWPPTRLTRPRGSWQRAGHVAAPVCQHAHRAIDSDGNDRDFAEHLPHRLALGQVGRRHQMVPAGLDQVRDFLRVVGAAGQAEGDVMTSRRESCSRRVISRMPQRAFRGRPG